ncbi:hypothetical protein PDJAM_G00115450, partial [Pangasius djambal]|nr:hypothetical protein [Pangasius djambal]
GAVFFAVAFEVALAPLQLIVRFLFIHIFIYLRFLKIKSFTLQLGFPPQSVGTSPPHCVTGE